MKPTEDYHKLLPIEQKNELELIIAEKNIDIIHLRDRIKELESQPLPIEGVEREWFSIEDMEKAFIAGRDAVEYDENGYWLRYNFIDWLRNERGLPPIEQRRLEPGELPY